ncbi:MAG TPA: hypothetical protein GX521_08775 [Firmicutes bacterium]|nr:hypothetical protein [Bacillota bacterium]
MTKTILVDKESDGKMYVERYVMAENESEDFTIKDDTFFYTITGYGVMNIEDYGYSIEQGTGILIHKDSEFTLTNTGDVELQFVIFGVK